MWRRRRYRLPSKVILCEFPLTSATKLKGFRACPKSPAKPVPGPHLGVPRVTQGMRREFFKARLLAGAQRALLYAFDELGMAVTRVRLRLPGETFESEVEKNITVQKFEIPTMNARFTSEKFAAAGDLQKAKGTLRYLKVGGAVVVIP